MPNLIACTIVSANYIPFARVFAQSFLEHHPTGEVWVCLVGDPPAEVDLAGEPYRVVLAEDLGIPRFQHFAFRYSILELNTAVKPYFLERLGELCACPALCYFDPDILVLEDLLPVYQALEDHDIALTPHILQPLEDERLPSERDLLLSGIYNLGFFGVRFNDRTLELLRWWQRRLYRYCEHRVEKGLFVDQRWMDFGPAFVDRARILRDPGLNVAYWNLAHRRIESAGNGYRVGSVPLRFFHFSGFHPDRPEVVSKYQNRISFHDRPDLLKLFEEYGRRLREAGLEELGELPYTYDRFDNGVRVPLYAREALKLIDPDGERWPNPFEAAARKSFFRWLLDPLPTDRTAIPRLALVMWDLRGDLQQHFPQPLGADAFRFLAWFEREVRTDPQLDPAFAKAITAARDEGSEQAAHQPGAETEPRVASLPSSLSHLIGDSGFRITRREARWLAADAGFEQRRRPRISRLAMVLHRHRADLQATFPDPLGRHRQAFALWYVTFGRLEYGLPGSLTRPALKRLDFRARWYARLWWVKRSAVRRLRPLLRRNGAAPLPPVQMEAAPAAAVPSADAPRGLNVVGWVNAPTGVGEACRGTLKALEVAGLGYRVWSLKHPGLEDASVGVTEPPPRLPFPVTLYHVNADMMPWVEGRLPLRTSRGDYRIGYWFWELAHFPLQFSDRFRYVDELWAPTRFCERAFAALSTVDIRWVPPAVREPAGEPLDRSVLGVPEDAFLFFFAFDAMSVPQRKNPSGLIDALSLAVEQTDRKIHLLLKVSHADGSRLLPQLQQQMRDLPVTLITTSMSRSEMSGLTATCDAYVSLHRSEGLGLPLIEAMYLGKPVIGTGYGGCTDFLDSTTGWVVDHRLVTLDRSYGPYPSGATWADPDPVHAASLLVRVAESPEEARERASAAERRVRELYSPQVAGERLRREIDRILAD